MATKLTDNDRLQLHYAFWIITQTTIILRCQGVVDDDGIENNANDDATGSGVSRQFEVP